MGQGHVTRVQDPGARGVEILTYKVTFRSGIQTHKELMRKVIVRAPATRVIAVGIKETQQCDRITAVPVCRSRATSTAQAAAAMAPPTFKDPFR